jgi:hypothetical protein
MTVMRVGLSMGAVVVALVAVGCGQGGGPRDAASDAADARGTTADSAQDAVADAGGNSSDASPDVAGDAGDGPPPDVAGDTGDGPPPDVAGDTGDGPPPDVAGDAGDGLPPDGMGDAGDGASTDAAPCVGEVLSAEASAAFFPLRTGARWIFRAAGTSNGVLVGPRLATREITGTKMLGAASAAVVFGREDELNTTTVEEYLEVTPRGLIDHGSSMPAAPSGRAGRYAAPFTAIPFPITTCAPYEQFNLSSAGGVADADGDGMPENLSARGTATLSFEDVTVPVGTFTKALRVETVEDVGVTYTKTPSTTFRTTRRTIDWYAAGAGPIKRRVERGTVITTSELIAYAVGDVRRGVLPTGWLARDLTEAETNPYTPNRPAVGFDGTRYLVVIPTSTQTSPSFYTGNLAAIVVDRDGKPVTSTRLLDASNALNAVAIAWDGTRYLVAYHNASYGRVEMVIVSPMGETIAGPVVLETVRASPSVIATQAGFLVSYQKITQEPGTLRNLTNTWFATVDAFGHPTARVQPYPATQQSLAAVAKDDAGGVMALFYTPPATASPTLPETANILAAARVTAGGSPVDATPFAVDAVPGVGHAEGQLIFDGTNFVAAWTQRVDSSTIRMHVARFTSTGTLLDGPATTGGGIDVSNGASPRITRFAGGSLIVWGHFVEHFFGLGIGGTRMTTAGRLLDVPGDNGGRWFIADYGANNYSLPEIVWGGDRALLVWANQSTSDSASMDDLFSIGAGVAYPW